MHAVAQTNLQLYNQLLERGWPREDLLRVRRAYDLASLLHAGYYQADGKPFVCHAVGVASILCLAGFPADFVAFGLLHNIYVNGDFGQGLGTRMDERKRDFVRERVGADIERLIFRFRDLRLGAKTIDKIEAGLSGYDETDRHLISADIADHIEKYLDAGVLYFGDGSWIAGHTRAYGARLIALAERLGQPLLAQMLKEAFQAANDHQPVPDILCPAPERKYVALTAPLSTRIRWLPRIRIFLKRMRGQRRANRAKQHALSNRPAQQQ